MSGPWERYAAASAPAAGPWTRFAAQGGAAGEERAKGGYIDNLVRSVAGGASFGFADELAAAGDATFGPLVDRFTKSGTSAAPTWSERYSENLTNERAQDKAFSAANPVASTAGNVVGGVASTVAALPAAASATAPTLVGNVARQGALGAGLGATAGFGAGEGGFGDRAAHAIVGGGVGGVIGSAFPVVGMVGKAAMETAPGRYLSEKIVAPAARSVASVFEGPTVAKSLSAAAPDGSPGVTGPMGQFADRAEHVAQSGAVDRLATAMQRGKISTTSAELRLTGLGDEAMLADVDPQFMSMARMANTLPGGTRTYAKTTLEARDRNAGNRLVQAFEGSEPPPSSFALRGEGQAFDQNLRAVGSSAYGDMVDAGLRQTPELIEIQSNPIVSRAIDTVMNIERQTRQGTSRAPASPVELMHKVKQSIWDMGFDGASARPGPNMSFYRDLGTRYMDALKRANPTLAEADRRYAQAASLPEFFDSGRSFLGRGSSEKATEASAPALGDMLRTADPQQRLATRAGSTNAVRETALEGTGPARALAKRIDESTPVRDKIGEIYGQPQGQSILRRAASEKQFAETSNEILRGSKTADKIAEVLDAGNTAVRIGGSGVTARILEKVDDVINRMAGPNEAVRDEIGRIMLNPNTAENQRILRLATEILRRRQAGSTARPASVEGLASALSEK